VYRTSAHTPSWLKQAVDGRDGHRRILQYLAPLPERRSAVIISERRSCRAAISSNGTLISAWFFVT
jgi:hypothetical protein